MKESKHRGIITLPEKALLKLIGFDNGKILNIGMSEEYFGIRVLLEDNSLPIVNPGEAYTHVDVLHFRQSHSL